MADMSVQQALQYVADNPVMTTDVMLDIPVYELVCRTLFEIANSPNTKVRGSLRRSTRAQRMIMDRLVGTRRPGTHPAARRDVQLLFVDLAEEAIEP